MVGAVYPCLSTPCQNSGVCQNKTNDYRCTCKDHFTGTNCESKHNTFNKDTMTHGMYIYIYI